MTTEKEHAIMQKNAKRKDSYAAGFGSWQTGK
jgi:hypothetical protein